MGRPCPPSLPAPTFARALGIGVSQSNILVDATISSSFQIKPGGYEEMKNSDEKVNIRAFRDEKQKKKLKKAKAVFRGGGEELLTYTR